MPVSKRLREALRWGDDELEDLADSFLDHKVFTYVETLADLFTLHGAEITDDDIDLSDAILLALRREARDHAASVVRTFNKELDTFLTENAKLPRGELLAAYGTWAEVRADSKAEQIAVTEAYSAHADAKMAFYLANVPEGFEPSFDFGGHGDDDPVCAVCEVLLTTSPHPLSRVLEVGSPHIACRQDWHETDDFEEILPEELKLPTEPAGIVGKSAYVNRLGNDHAVAAAAIEALAAAE